MSELSCRVLVCCAALVACIDQGSAAVAGDALLPAATLVDQRADQSPHSSVEYLNGKYGLGCSERVGDWSLAFAATPQALDYPPLSLEDGDDDCELTITAARTADGQLHVAQASVPLSPSYADGAVAFGQPPVFYAVAKLDPRALQGTAELTFVVAEEPPAPPAPLVSFTATALGASVPAPDYGIDIATLTIEIDIDGVVQDVRGSAHLQRHAIGGVAYALAVGRITSYDALDAAYLREGRPLTTIIPATDFGLVGVNLKTTQTRTLIVANVVDGVRAYQAFVLRFDPPRS